MKVRSMRRFTCDALIQRRPLSHKREAASRPIATVSKSIHIDISKILRAAGVRKRK